MFSGDMRRMIGILSEPGSASGQVLSASLATTLGAAGSKVLLLDESLTTGEVHPMFGMDIVRDLSQVLRDKSSMKSALTKITPGVDFLAGGLGYVAHRPEVASHTGFINAFYRLAGAYDVVLINAVEDGAGYPSFTWAAQDIIVLCGDRGGSVTTAYARIKALCQAGKRRFHLLFEQMSAERAQMLYRNLAAVSHRHLREFPEDLGVLPWEATEVFFTVLADSVREWPLPENRDGHFRAFMQRLMREEPMVAQRAAVRSS
jgi:MinD-like ATPase involved in chromosome partitioning or flagellar assembly